MLSRRYSASGASDEAPNIGVHPPAGAPPVRDRLRVWVGGSARGGAICRQSSRKPHRSLKNSCAWCPYECIDPQARTATGLAPSPIPRTFWSSRRPSGRSPSPRDARCSALSIGRRRARRATTNVHRGSARLDGDAWPVTMRSVEKAGDSALPTRASSLSLSAITAARNAVTGAGEVDGSGSEAHEG